MGDHEYSEVDTSCQDATLIRSLYSLYNVYMKVLAAYTAYTGIGSRYSQCSLYRYWEPIQSLHVLAAYTAYSGIGSLYSP